MYNRLKQSISGLENLKWKKLNMADGYYTMEGSAGGNGNYDF